MATVDLTFFEVTDLQLEVATLGRKMMAYAETNSEVPLEILNAFSRIGENLAENTTANIKLSEVDKMVVKYARKMI